MKDYDLDYRPDYWNEDGLLTGLVANIKGAERKRAVLDALRCGDLSQVESFLLEEKLTDRVRKAVGAIHLRFMGGEYLPDTFPGEVEIARVTYASMLQDVTSIRARPGGGMIHYRVVDEYEADLTCTPETTEEPLTLGALIGLMDSVEGYDYDSLKGLTVGFLDMHVECGACPYDEEGFITVTSGYYSDLESYYDQEMRIWFERVTAAEEDEEA